MRHRGLGKDPVRSMVLRLWGGGLEEAGSRMLGQHDTTPSRHPSPVRVCNRLVEGESMRSTCRTRYSIAMGPFLGYRGVVGLDHLHGLLHFVEVPVKGMDDVQEVRESS